MSPLLIWSSSLESLQDRLRWREKVPHWCISFGTSWRGFLSLWSDFRGKYIIHSFVDMGLKVRMTTGRCKKRRFNPYFPFFFASHPYFPFDTKDSFMSDSFLPFEVLRNALNKWSVRTIFFRRLGGKYGVHADKGSNLLSLLHSLNTQLSLY